jgi:branched-chain amino acid transport system permease protein
MKPAGISIPLLTIIIPVIMVTLLLCLLYLVHKTRIGMAMRACAKDFETAGLMSIDVNRVITITFGIGSLLAAVGGILWSLKYPQIHPLIGVMPGLKCFCAAVLGGIGNITGAVIGGLILGFVEIMLVAFMPGLSGYRDAFAFLILILILLFRPTGILGEKIAEKV